MHGKSEISCGRWANHLINDIESLNKIFGPINQNGKRNVNELGIHLLKDFNDSKKENYQKFQKTAVSSGLKQFSTPLEPSESDSSMEFH